MSPPNANVREMDLFTFGLTIKSRTLLHHHHAIDMAIAEYAYRRDPGVFVRRLVRILGRFESERLLLGLKAELCAPLVDGA